jgi:hypothetical protein
LQAYLVKVLMYGSKMFRVAKALTPLDPTQQEQRVALGKLDRVAIGISLIVSPRL